MRKTHHIQSLSIFRKFVHSLKNLGQSKEAISHRCGPRKACRKSFISFVKNVITPLKKSCSID